jgi:MMPL family protein
VRNAVHAVPDADARVGGGTAALLDMDTATTHDNYLIIPLVLAMVLLVLTMLLRSVIAPLLLIGTVVLSFAAALGLSALAFRYIFDYAGETTDFPLFVFVFLVALGIDYNIFLSTRIREEAGRQGTRAGVLTGLAATGAVITSAGLVLAGTFAGLARCRWSPSRRSASRWRSACFSTPLPYGPCWSRRCSWTWDRRCGGQAGWSARTGRSSRARRRSGRLRRATRWAVPRPTAERRASRSTRSEPRTSHRAPHMSVRVSAVPSQARPGSPCPRGVH